jgi:hypothetical protein
MPSLDSRKRTAGMGQKSSDYPSLKLHEEKIFIVVKTYPRPSTKYRELVCTAGITEKGKWIRLYPVSFRYLDYSKWYKKYQWISLKIEKSKNDFLIDSFRPIENSVSTLGEVFTTDKDKRWDKRKRIILPTIRLDSLEEIEYECQNCCKIFPASE